MIDPIGPAESQALANTQNGQKKVLKMVKASRMGGSMPVWETVSSPKQEVEKNLSVSETWASGESFKTSLVPGQEQTHIAEAEEFGFGDLLDMINPLHHIPVVGHVYRSITGDEIKPIGRIIGGAAFGGPAGAAAGLVNVVVEDETGRDVAGNAMALLIDGETPNYKSQPKEAPETLLAKASRASEKPDLPASLLAFTDLKNDSGIVIEAVRVANGRTAGNITRPRAAESDPLNLVQRQRDAITQVMMRPFPDDDR